MTNYNTYNTIPIIMTRKEMQEILHISKTTALHLLKNGYIEYFMIGKSYRITKDSLEDFIKNSVYIHQK